MLSQFWKIHLVLIALYCSMAASALPADENIGPLVGAVDSNSARLLVRRGAAPGRFELRVTDDSGATVAMQQVETVEASDFVAHFTVEKLKPATFYRYQIFQQVDGKMLCIAEGDEFRFRTASDQRSGYVKTICFTSCVDIEPNPMWDDMLKLRPDLVCLMGDTPYIDTIDLKVVRQRHREFLNIPVFEKLIRFTPTVGTWDDHDFGVNNGNGRNLKEGRVQTRTGFVDYRAHRQYGNGTEGVYHKVDLGMIEVFLLDPRYFSQTEPSPVDPKQPTCFGSDQWNWLLKNLKTSEAPFKVLAMGAIWQDKKNAETDDMFTYWYERDALLDFIIEEKITGVVLLGGDIHVSRHLIHRDRVNYDLHDFIISPGHGRVITSLNVFHPDLEWSLVEGQQFLSLTADGTQCEPMLTAKFLQGGGRVHRAVEIPLSGLMPLRMQNLQHKLRAWWNFETDFKNQSLQGKRLDAVVNSEAAQIPEWVADDGAVQFQRTKQQFLVIPKNPLDDNSDQHSVSLWFKPTSLPRHGTDERYFLFESTAEGQPDPRSAWHLSLGLRACGDPDKVNLQLYTHTIAPAARPEASPAPLSQGGFDCLILREELKPWTHVAVVYDSVGIKLYLNGREQVRHVLPVPGPASEFGGLILGGHRAGTGRNFDGLIDEVAIWKRILEPSEIAELAGDRAALK